jgi:hypothetical protein
MLVEAEISKDIDLVADMFLGTDHILRDLGISDRGLRKKIRRGAFPAPDCNVAGRNLWKSSTYRKWKADALNGMFARKRPTAAPSPTQPDERKAA